MATELQTRNDYIVTLRAALLALGITSEPSGFYGLRANGLDIYVEAHERNESIRSVSFTTGYARRKGRHTYRNTDPVHIAKQIQRISAEKAKEQADIKAYRERQDALYAREEAAQGLVAAAVNDINGKQDTLRLGHKVRKLTTSEQQVNGVRTYHFGFSVEGLTEAQALAILAIVEGA